MTASHAMTINGRVSMELWPQPGLSLEEELTVRLQRLDGESVFAYLLWRLPEGVPFDRYDLGSGPTEYIQCAGGVARRFTCEIRVAFDGGFRQFVIGRRDDTGSRATSDVVLWDGHETAVQENEVLSVREVAELFRAYLVDEAVPAAYECRSLVL